MFSMPYPGMSDDPETIAKMEDCVKKVIAQGHDKSSAIAICHKSIAGKKETTLTVYKQADGGYRWVAVSSSAYRDRDGEIVSTKALENDCARADAEGHYGELRWWHTPIAIGQCDFNAMHGRMLVESGTFKDARVAEAVMKHGSDLALSIGFTHPATEPDSTGTFHRIRRFERSLLPHARASNLFTALSVTAAKEFATMTDEKKEAFEKLVGTDAAAEALTQAEATQKTADEAKVAFKEADAPAPVVPVVKEVEAPAPAAPVEQPPAPVTIGSWTPEQFQAILLQTLKPLIEATQTTQKEARKSSEDVSKAIGDLAGRVAELEGDAPKTVKTAHVASTSEGTIVEALQAAMKATAPNDSLKQWREFMTNNVNGNSAH